ncbi:hypothetical protein MAPG_09526 [Magnaporthiopsis poae ATCC 64411]|uniref:Uncharacterized protein n=1 Tax=Magnaporthiopsis poae (strain ATCC 64411 / 73-15) TaxID=644358 RepID=A0A0C4EA67_MAGP6|nr:hypothetical protein MAPG_09526 [Magnaporthiopsis poae ATCC 64411]
MVFEKADCTNMRSSVPSDAGIAGTGVLLSFIFTAALALAMSASLIFQEFRACRRKDGYCKPHAIRRKLLNSYSDQQILTGIGLQSVGLAKAATLVPYHFFIIWMLSLLSMAVHNATLLALVHDFRRDWVLRWLRQFLMFVNLALSCLYGVYMLRATAQNLEPTMPIACVWGGGGTNTTNTTSSSGPGGGDRALNYIGTSAVIAGNCAVFALATWYLHSRSQRFYKTIQVVGVVLMVAIAVGAAVRIGLLSQAFGTPTVPLADRGETEWSFGQLLSLLMLLLPAISVLEIYRGDLKVAPPVEDKSYLDGSASSPGAREEEEMQKNPRVRTNQNNNTFDPNPFFGSQTDLFKK